MLMGISRRMAMGMAMFILATVHLAAGEAAPDGMVSIRRNAVVFIGGEIRADLAFRAMNTSGITPGIKLRETDFIVRNASLRINAEMHPNLKAVFKINLDDSADNCRPDGEVLAEAMLVMRAVGGTGLEFFAGKGRAPYGQDVALGMLQSYHHSANRVDTPEGRIYIIDPPADATAHGRPDGRPLPPMRPGQFEQAFLAGAAYEWDERWRVEIAAFQPGCGDYRARLGERDWRGVSGSDIGFAGRAWLRPVEDLTIEASAMAAHSSAMGRTAWRSDLPAGAEARSDAYALSLGFDWRPGPWRIFGEYQKGWDWNFSKNYDTSTWQAGAAREFADAWRVGGMAEGLRIKDPDGKKTVDDYYKLTLNVRYMFSTGLFILAEYGHEWFRREIRGELSEKRNGNFFGVRMGLNF